MPFICALFILCFFHFQLLAIFNANFVALPAFKVLFIMPTTINLPEDFRAEVKRLPESQLPFGQDCKLAHKFQSIFFHYDVPKEVLMAFISVVGANRVSICMADPDSAESRPLFNEGIKEIQNVAGIHKLRLAVRRLCLDDPFAALGKRKLGEEDDSRKKIFTGDKGKAASESQVKSSSRSSGAGSSSKEPTSGKDFLSKSSSKSGSSSKADSGKPSSSKSKAIVIGDEESDSDLAEESSDGDDDEDCRGIGI